MKTSSQKIEKTKEVIKALNISYPTLYKMAERKEIDSMKVGNNTMYDLDKYLREHKLSKETKEKICYCRVSSSKQKEDLDRQIKYRNSRSY